MASRKPPRKSPPIRADRLVDGWDGPSDTRIRLARPDDVAQMRESIDAEGLLLDDAVARDLTAGRTSQSILRGLHAGPDAMLRPLAEAASASDPGRAMPGLVLPLVAQDSQGRLAGTLVCVPPGNVMSEAAERGIPVPLAMLGAARIAKVQTLTVAPAARGQRLGQALLRRAMRIFFQLDYFLIYGQFGVGTGLGAYYQRLGFRVHDEGAQFDLDRMSLPVVLGAVPGEQLFTKWRP
ncbi:GNAT family N-acetyltransferase [Actinocatenispora comari]|uniref:N-acetyltransferase n=1 Tax=Actinocatenispora comari TaxID=2807577 RepID=A0A8J4ACN6_9ACTN|nr:GNAT family N-acetyltransferase [Actinocatenispora comari]GIL29156.1 N-acetyltransferase [Actinocatenispora comari]